jgi:hypothetical protein
MGVKAVEAFGDAKLIVQQIEGESQCVDGVLNAYRDKCVVVIRGLDTFHIRHIPRKENSKANALAQQASGLEIRKGMFFITERLTLLDVSTTDLG